MHISILWFIRLGAATFILADVNLIWAMPIFLQWSFQLSIHAVRYISSKELFDFKCNQINALDFSRLNETESRPTSRDRNYRGSPQYGIHIVADLVMGFTKPLQFHPHVLSVTHVIMIYRSL